MLSVEQRSNRAAYKFRNGMINLGSMIGFVTDVNPRGGMLAQTQNANMSIPFEMGPHDRMPRNIKKGSIVKLVGRMEGRTHENGESTMVFRVLFFDNPRVLEMPPEETWFKTKVTEAAAVDVTPKQHQFAIRFDHEDSKFNSMSLWGHIAAMRVRRPGVVQGDGKGQSGCIYLKLQQSADPKDVIPVRLYGSAVNSYLQKLRIGMRVKVDRAQLRADVKPKGEKPTDGSPQAVDIYYFVKAKELLPVLPQDFADGVYPSAPPDWVIALRESNEATRRELIKQRAAQAEAKKTATEETGEGQAPSGEGSPAGEAEGLSEAQLRAMIQGATAVEGAPASA